MTGGTHRTIDGLIRRALAHIQVSPGSSSVFALVDGARDPKIYPLLMAEGNESRCLYGDDVPKPLARVSPYLVAMGSEHPFSEHFARLGHGHDWGLMLRSEASMDELARHFARLIRVRLHDDRTVLFRFFDPRVLRIFLPTCNSRELDRIFGPVKAFLIEQEDGGWLVYRRELGALVLLEPRWDRWID